MLSVAWGRKWFFISLAIKWSALSAQETICKKEIKTRSRGVFEGRHRVLSDNEPKPQTHTAHAFESLR